jgi:hypothetical protein
VKQRPAGGSEMASRVSGGWNEARRATAHLLPGPSRSLSVHELKPAWSRVFLCRYILRLKARIRELEKRLATYE